MLGWFRRRSSKVSGSATQERLSPKDRWRKKYAQYHLGTITHYYSDLGVGIILIEKDELQVDDIIYVRGHKTFFKQRVTSIEYQHRKVRRVGKGYEVGVKMGAKVRSGDDVYIMPPSSA